MRGGSERRGIGFPHIRRNPAPLLRTPQVNSRYWIEVSLSRMPWRGFCDLIIKKVKRNTVRENRGGGGFGGGGGGASAAAETKQLGYYAKDKEEELVPPAWEVENGLSPRATWRSLLWLYPCIIGGRVGLVDSAREKNKARAVVEGSAFI
jgi:hypothetical protein